MISFETSGSFRNTERFLQKMRKNEIYSALDKFGKEGVDALASTTPKDTTDTANSWYYEIKRTRSSYSVTWFNRNVNQGVPIAILIQYGHGTGTGGYVQGIDYINPALRPVFDRIAADVWKAVTSA